MHGYYLEDLEPGMKSTFGKTVTEADILMFAGMSGDPPGRISTRNLQWRRQFKGRIATAC